MDVPKTPGDNSVVPPTAHCAVHNNLDVNSFIVSPSELDTQLRGKFVGIARPIWKR